MNPDVKREWVAALRSGEYKQTTARLCRDNGRMCCLGVLIDACVDGEWELNTARSAYEFEGYGLGLHRTLRERLGITIHEAEILVELNDTKGQNFVQIATWIEKNL